MKKVMVLGAGGWLGERLIERLVAAKREVICVDIRLGERVRQFPGVEIIEADIRNLAAFAARLDDCSAVFNCCGVQHPKATQDIYEVNATAPEAVYKACIDRGVDTFVHVSSINSQGENESSTVYLDETQPPRPRTHYGISKIRGDLALMEIAATASTRLIILRPGVFYGERPSKNLQEFMDKLATSSMPLFSKFGMLRTYVDVEKVVDALVLSESNGRSGEAYLVGDEEPLSTLRFYQVVADELGVKPKILRVPLLAAKMCDRIAFLAGRANRHIRLFTIVGEFGRHTFCNSSKAVRELNFVPHRSSDEGLRRMVRSVRKAA